MRRRALVLLRRSWPALRFVLGIALALVALSALSGQRGELQGVASLFDHLKWWWLPVAVVVESASIVALTGMQVRLLEVGGLRPPVRPMIATTLGSQALTNSLPGGTAFAVVYAFRWFRRYGADDTLAAWALVGTMVGAAVSLSLVAAGGLAMATGLGGSLDLIPAILGVLCVAVAIGAVFIYERPLAGVVSRAVRVSRKTIGRPHGDVAEHIDKVVARIRMVQLGWSDVSAVVGWGLMSWLADCTCFVVAFVAVGAPVPWSGLLLAYGAGQLAANLPITPGGLGTVEGSITLALVAFGGARTATVDAVMIYRLVSFWLVLVVGWFSCGAMALAVRRGRWPRHALRALVDPSVPDGDGQEEGGKDAGGKDTGGPIRVDVEPREVTTR
ncbi:MAG: YbhN family protein [Actinobacteria bacterium]|nr:YbhN family protein [Actinomycetota bacterium]